MLWLLLAGVFLCAPEAFGREPGKWAIGAHASYHVPVGSLNDWYFNSVKYGLNVSYVISSRLTTEVEYHRSVFGNSSVPHRFFNYRGRGIQSPGGDSEMTWNALSNNWLWYFREEEDATERTRRSPYALLGVGFYDYSHRVEGLIYPGNGVIPSQLAVNSGSNVDLTLVYPGSAVDPGTLSQSQRDQMGVVQNNQVTLFGLVPTEDTRTAWTVILALGMEQSLGENLGLDVRARYNVVFGDINPLLSWGLDKVFPITMVDVGASLKLYFD